MPTKKAGKSRKSRKSPASSKQVVRRSTAPRPQQRADSVQAKVRRVTPLVDLGRIWAEVFPFLPLEFRITFRRPDDLLVCDFVFDNLQLSSDGPTRLVKRDPSKHATLIVELPPQSFGEQAFLEATGPVKEKFPETSPATKPKNSTSPGDQLGQLPLARIRMSGRSRVAFAMPSIETELPFTLEAILDACRRWPMRLDVNAAPDRDTRLIDEFKRVDAFSKRWLAEIQAGGTWNQTALNLVDALGGGSVQKALASGARRIARMAADSSTTAAGETEATLRTAMNDELDALAARYAPLQDETRREVAMAALALMTTDALAKTRGELTAEVVKAFPFLPIVFAPHEPSPVVTALELPYRIILSPIPHSNWWHRILPVTRNGRTELWHTRLTQTTNGKGPDQPTKVRALWSPDYRPEPNNPEIVAVTNGVQPYRMSLDAMDRLMLVKLMSDFTEPNFRPRAARAERLSLSALGAICDIEGRWKDLPVGVGLEQWRHLATLGRDQYVRVVYRGSLCELGHAASLIKVTERKFEKLPGSGKSVAVLRQRFFIVVTEPVKNYTGAGHQFQGRNFSFTSVEILTRVTPNLLDPGDNACKLSANGINPSGANDAIYGTAAGGGSTPHRACFWPMLGPNNDFQFQMAGTDLAGTVHTFSMPLLFVGKEANDRASVMTQVLNRYNDDLNKGRRTTSLGNSVFCFAPPDEDSEGDPRLPTRKMIFGAGTVSGLPAKDPKYYPEIELATVGIAAIQRLLQQPDAVVDVTYTETYKKNGFGGANAGEVFLKTTEPFALDFGTKVKSDTLGGLATPSMAIQGLSRIMGPVAAQPPSSATPANIEQALAKVIANNFNPGDFFKGAKILGGVDLSKILGILPKPLGGENVPKLLSKQLPDRIEARFDWKTDINESDPLGLFVPNAGGQTVLEMHGIVSSPIAQPNATTFDANATIVHFKVNLFGFITVWFDRLKFSSKSGSKPDVAVDLHPGTDAITFGGPLEFVNELRQIIPANGFSDPPNLAVTPAGLSASYSLSVPTIAVGIFALEHVSLGAAFNLPFDAKPAEVRFNFAERQRPFSLTVSLLGGGGFFAIGVGAEGVREIEAALEFGAALSIDLGVASGSVEIKAGVYFHWMTKSVELAGYVRLHGELSVLGLISASLTFNLQLAYRKDSGRSVVWGEATLEVEIEILFLSFSVSVSCRREFGGSNSDPKFIELIPDQNTWASYCEAFALEGI